MSFNLKMVQNAYVVDSIEATCEELHKNFGLGPFVVVRGLKLENHRYRGIKTDDVILDAAVTHSGDVQIELVELKNNVPNAMREMYTGKGTVLHHVAHLNETYEYAKVQGDLVEAGYPVVSEFTVYGGNDICFVDTRPVFNHMLQLYTDREHEIEIYRKVREAVEGADTSSLYIEW
jgi:hypothetical protein